MQYGADSKEFLVCRNYRRRISVHSSWKRKLSLKSMGHFIEDDAGIHSCFEYSKAAMWSCFYANLSAGLMAASTKAKMRFLRSSVSSIPSFRWARWPYQDSYASTLDSIQRHMIGILMGWRPSVDESFEAFRHRRHRLSSDLAAEHGEWSTDWATLR